MGGVDNRGSHCRGAGGRGGVEGLAAPGLVGHARSWGGAVCAWLGALLLLSSPALATRSNEKAIWGPTTRNGVSEFPLYHAMGVGIYEAGLNWSAVAPSHPVNARNPADPAYHWPADIDYALSQASRYHMRVLLEVFDTPRWANGGHPSNYVPRHVRDLTDFVIAAARRYPKVRLWMVWGEPSRRPNFMPLKPARPSERKLTRAQAWAPRRYAQMLDASYGALKAANRRNVIIGGDTYTTGDIDTSQWIRYMRLPNGRPPRLDLYGHNPFSFRDPDLSNPPSPHGEVDFSDLGRLSRLVDQNLAAHGHHIRLFLSEWTIPTAPDSEFNIYVDPKVQAKWIKDAWQIVRRSSFIYALGWIHVYDDPPGGSQGGLFFHNGNPKPGYYAWKAG
jgi:hypothetical protein